ncbi:hypothetical protein GCM10009755_01900 [Brevibacterium samyangense]|uniref:DUF350 domain-containing protein n=2 Tax=Brevibacterium samyangense TaxID=366888 RepID=A0ABN2T457_9MICO
MELFRALVGVFVLIVGTVPALRRMRAMNVGEERPGAQDPVSRVSGGVALLSGVACFLFVLAVFALPVWALIAWFAAAAVLVWAAWLFVVAAPRLPWLTPGRRRKEILGAIGEGVFVLVAVAALGLAAGVG